MTISRYQELVLSDWFWLGMMVIMVIAISSLSYYYAKYRKNVRLVESLIKGQTREELAWKRQEILEKAKLSSVKAGKLWVEFDESEEIAITMITIIPSQNQSLSTSS